MRNKTVALLSALGLLTACATTPATDHSGMSHDEMMRHCAMMDQHDGAGAAAHQHDPARHGGMSHEQMVRHCQMMRDQAAPAPAPSAPATPHQH